MSSKLSVDSLSATAYLYFYLYYVADYFIAIFSNYFSACFFLTSISDSILFILSVSSLSNCSLLIIISYSSARLGSSPPISLVGSISQLATYFLLVYLFSCFFYITLSLLVIFGLSCGLGSASLLLVGQMPLKAGLRLVAFKVVAFLKGLNCSWIQFYTLAINFVWSWDSMSLEKLYAYVSELKLLNVSLGLSSRYLLTVPFVLNTLGRTYSLRVKITQNFLDITSIK